MKRLRTGLGRLLSLLRRVRVDAEDVLLMLGLVSVGYGLWWLAGVGVAAVVVGALLLAGGLLPAVSAALAARASRPPERRR